MKYTININQKAIIDLGLSLDVIDLSIFDFCASFMLSNKCTSINHDGKVYYWITAKTIIEGLPIIGISTERGINKRIENLILANLLVRCPDNQKMKSSYFRLGELADEYLFASRNDCSNKTWNDCSNDYNISNYNKKEEIDKSISKKELAKDIVDFWNANTTAFPKVRITSQDIIVSVDKLQKRGYSIDDIKKAILLCNSLSDFYKGKEKGKKWKATLQWLIKNTKDNFDLIMNGALHTSQEQQRIYQSVMEEGVESQSTKYIPYTEGYHLWFNENDGKYYFTGNIINLADGYTKDNRPNGAQVHQNGYTYTWNATSKEWEMG